MPVIFPEHVTHSQIKLKGAKPISAGFFKLRGLTGIPVLYGESVSLKLKPHPNDADLLQMVMSDHDRTSDFLDFNNKPR